MNEAPGDQTQSKKGEDNFNVYMLFYIKPKYR